MFTKKFFSGKNIIFIGLVIALLFIFPKIIGILLLFFAAYVLACALNPSVTKLSKKINRTAAATIVVLTSILAIIALFVPIIFIAFKEIRTFVTTLPDKLTAAANYLMNTEFYGHKIPDMFDFDAILGNSSTFAQNLVNHSWTFTMSVAQLVVITVALTMIVYYILVDKKYLKDKFLQFFPPDLKDKADNILSIISNKVGGYVRAQLLSMAAVGLMMALVLVILGVEYSTLLGLITGLFDIIPILGPAIALAVILLVAYPMGIVKVVLILVGFLLVQQISNYVVRPVLFGKLMELHPLNIFLALFLAQQFLGFWGVILSPAIAATICVLIDELYLKPINLNNQE